MEVKEVLSPPSPPSPLHLHHLRPLRFNPRVRRFLPLLLLVTAIGCTEQGSSSAPTTKPLGELSTPQDLAAKADVPIYPGASLPENRSNIKRDGAEARYEIFLLTPDKPDKVMAFYKEKLPKGQMVGTQYMPLTPKGNYGSITATPEGSLTKISIVVRSTEK